MSLPHSTQHFLDGTAVCATSATDDHRYRFTDNSAMATSSRIKTEFKVLLVGDPGVGKTSLLLKTEGNRQQVEGIEVFDVHSFGVCLHVWDLPSQRENEALPNAFFHSADAAIVMYDLTSSETFWNVYKWMAELRNHKASRKIFLVGGKSDLTRDLEVYPYDHETLTEEENLRSFVTSARTGHQIDKLFDDVAASLTVDAHEEQEIAVGEASEVVFLGSAEVGKTALIMKYTKGTFLGENRRSVDADFIHHITDLGHCQVKLRIVDIPGQVGLRERCKAACQHARVAVAVFDLTKKATFSELAKVMEFIDTFCPSVRETFLVGNKSDLIARSSASDAPHEGKREVQPRDVEELKRHYRMRDFQTSAKTGDGVENLFNALAAALSHHQDAAGGQVGPVTLRVHRNFRGLIVGSLNVGKTSLLRRYENWNFGGTQATIGINVVTLHVLVEGQRATIQFADTAGMEELSQNLLFPFFRESDVVIVMYDVTRRNTFERAEFWLDEARRRCREAVKIFLVGGKRDCAGRQVEFSQAQAWANQRRLQFFETSSKFGLGVNTLFNSLARSLLDEDSLDASSSLHLQLPDSESDDLRRGCCCLCC